MPLPFYGDDWHLIDLVGRTVEGIGAAMLVSGPDEVQVVDGQSPLVHRLNLKQALRLPAESAVALAYLKYFTGVVWGDLGPFTIVESEGEAAALLDGNLGGEGIGAVSHSIVDGIGVYSAHVVYGGHLFKARFSAAETGKVDMLEDDEVLKGRSRLLFDRPLRVLPFNQHSGGLHDESL